MFFNAHTFFFNTNFFSKRECQIINYYGHFKHGRTWPTKMITSINGKTKPGAAVYFTTLRRGEARGTFENRRKKKSRWVRLLSRRIIT